MAKKLLYVGRDFEKAKTGGEICCLNMQKVLQSVFGSFYKKYSLSVEAFVKIIFIISRTSNFRFL